MNKIKKTSLYFIILLFILQFLPYQMEVASADEITGNMDSSTNIVLQGIGLANPTKVYKQPSTNSYSLKSYVQGTILKYKIYTTDWYKCTVYINGKAVIGYIKSGDVENTKFPQKYLKGIALINPTKIFFRASKNSVVLKAYAQGSVLKYKTLSSSWNECTVYIKGRATKGYIYTGDVDNISSKQIAIRGVPKSSHVNVYSKAATSSTILRAYIAGTILKYKTFSSFWYECTVYIKGRATKGYIKKTDVKNVVQVPVLYTGVGLKSPTKIYEKASSSSKVLKSYSQGKILKYQSFVNGWYSATIYLNGKKTIGYINTTDVENAKTPSTNVQAWGIKKLKVFSYASSNAHVLKSYANGAELKLQTFTASWYQARVYINGVAHTGYVRVSDVSTRPYLDLDLRKPANVTAQDIVYFFNKKRPDSPLKNYAQNFINVQNKYGINALYLVAHAIWETGWGGSNLINYKNNLYGYGAYNVCPFTCGYYFPTIEDSIDAVAYMIKISYLTPGGPYYHVGYGSSLKGMNINYATDQNWKYGIANLMESMKPYDGKYYASASVLPLKGSDPSNLSRDIPAGSPYPVNIKINFPQEITALITDDTMFRTLPYTKSTTLISKLSEATSIIVLGYNTDVKDNGDYPYDHRWYRVSVNGKIGWVYGKNLDILNLLQVKGVSSSLNIRNNPVNGDIIGSVSANGYLKAVIEDGKPVVQNNWYNVYLPNSTKMGWVSGTYINIIDN